MIDVEWSADAEEDVDAILAYYEDRTLRFATHFLTDVRTVVMALHGSPFLGRVVAEKGDPLIREVLIRGYKLEYRLDLELPTLLYILRVTYSGF